MTFISQFEYLSHQSHCANIALWTIFGFGVLKLTTLVLRVIALSSSIFLLPTVNFKKYGAKKGAYCVITGASDGIGLEFAKQMAKRGFNLVLISRTLAKLEALQEDIKNQYGVDVEILAMDFTQDKKENYTAIKEKCSGLPITVLINNVGQSHSIPVPFLETTEEELRNIITVNTTATLLVTQMVAPIIVQNARSGDRGLILTMGSFGGLLPTPYLATYSGSKAFLQNWSSALAGELANSKVDVELVLSYLVTSSMSKIRKTSFLIPNPHTFVSSTLRNLGRRVGAQERFGTMTPYWSHALYHFVIEETFGVYSKIVNSINLGFHKSIRVRALKKATRMAKQN